MCVLTYLPLADEGFILTHSRDEHVARPRALTPHQYKHGGVSVVYPKDPQAGGTWIATSAAYSLCLLNGAFENHLSQPPYRQSRGLVVLEFFDYQGVEDFVSRYAFEGIEPFTLVVVDTAQRQLTELRWDAQQLRGSLLDASVPHIWSSATLYPLAVRQAREAWFAEWLSEYPAYDAAAVMQFHLYGGTGDTQNDMLMNRFGQLLTQSITQIEHHADGQYSLMYQDLLAEQEKRYCVI